MTSLTSGKTVKILIKAIPDKNSIILVIHYADWSLEQAILSAFNMPNGTAVPKSYFRLEAVNQDPVLGDIDEQFSEVITNTSEKQDDLGLLTCDDRKVTFKITTGSETKEKYKLLRSFWRMINAIKTHVDDITTLPFMLGSKNVCAVQTSATIKTHRELMNSSTLRAISYEWISGKMVKRLVYASSSPSASGNVKLYGGTDVTPNETMQLVAMQVAQFVTQQSLNGETRIFVMNNSIAFYSKFDVATTLKSSDTKLVADFITRQVKRQVKPEDAKKKKNGKLPTISMVSWLPEGPPIFLKQIFEQSFQKFLPNEYAAERVLNSSKMEIGTYIKNDFGIILLRRLPSIDFAKLKQSNIWHPTVRYSTQFEFIATEVSVYISAEYKKYPEFGIGQFKNTHSNIWFVFRISTHPTESTSTRKIYQLVDDMVKVKKDPAGLLSNAFHTIKGIKNEYFTVFEKGSLTKDKFDKMETSKRVGCGNTVLPAVGKNTTEVGVIAFEVMA